MDARHIYFLVVFIIAASLLIFLFAYGRHLKRTLPPEGPSDPSKNWRNTSNASNDRAMDSEYEFHHTKGTLAISLWISPFPLIFSTVIYIFSLHSAEPLSVAGWLLLWLLPLPLLALAHASLRAFKVKISKYELSVKKLFSERKISFSEISSVNLLQGGRGKLILRLINRKNKQLIQFNGDLGDFQSMVALIKDRGTRAGAVYRYRDQWGNWTK
jgi:hypothetical protein